MTNPGAGPRWRTILAIAISILSVFTSFADVVYDNLVTAQSGANGKPFFTGQRGEFGDEIQLTGNARQVTDFYLYYYGNFVSQGDETVIIRFYKNNFPLPHTPDYVAPGTLLYQSAPTTISPDYGKVHLSGLSVLVPNNFTFTVEFHGVTMNIGDEVGLLFYSPISIGTSYDDFWQRNGGGNWELLAYPGLKNNFGVMVLALPESGTIKSITAANGQSSVISLSTPGRIYSLEYRENFQPGSSWRRFNPDNAVTATASTVTLLDTTPRSAQRFYQVVERTTSISLANSDLTITSASVSGKTYRLESTSDFVTWSPVGPPKTATSSTIVFTTPKTTANKFFRVVQL